MHTSPSLVLGPGPSVKNCNHTANIRSNLKYESVCIDSKTVVFIRANPGKKETTDRSGSHVNSIQKQCTFLEVVSPEKWYVTNIKPYMGLGIPQKTYPHRTNVKLIVMFTVVLLAVVSGQGTK